MIKKQTFFNKLTQLSDLKGFKNLKSFAEDGLNYKSYQKLNRLKDSSNQPGYQILLDISNKFDDVNIHWLITGKGEMLLKNNDQQQLTDVLQVNEDSAAYRIDKEKEGLYERIEELKETIQLLKQNNSNKKDIA